MGVGCGRSGWACPVRTGRLVMESINRESGVCPSDQEGVSSFA